VLGTYRLLVLVVLVVATVDQATKALAAATLDDGEVVPLLGRAVDLRLRANPGLAWGLGGGQSAAVRRALVPALELAVGLVLCGMYRRLEPQERLLRWGAALIVGGGLGNLVDRARLGHVVDFVGIHLISASNTVSGTFNLADGALAAGVLLVAGGVLRRRRSHVAREEGSE
jgi:signal peptidase II